MTAFQVWKDYFQLAKVVQGMGFRGPQQSPEQKRLGLEGELMCSFCKHNGESRSVYASHRLKDEAGRVQCPVLRSYTCPQCGASQDLAHTRRFCPLTKEGYNSVYRACTRNSAGKKKQLRKAGDAHLRPGSGSGSRGPPSPSPSSSSSSSARRAP